MRPVIFHRPIARATLGLYCLLAVGATRAADWAPPLDDALKQAAVRHAPLLLDFHAPWCSSCDYMAHHVLEGPEWARVQRLAVVVDLDVDTPRGAEWQRRFSVQKLPTYVLLDEHGVEFGRIAGALTRAEFYRRVDGWLAHPIAFDALRAAVRDGSPAALHAAQQVLEAYDARADAGGALDWFAGLPDSVQHALRRNAHTAVQLARLRLMQAAQKDDAAACVAAAPPVLNADLGCARPEELTRAMRCTAPLPAAPRRALFATQKPAMMHLLYSRVFVSRPTCADARSAVLVTADLDHLLGYDRAAAALLGHAIADVERRLGGRKTSDLKRDRNLADDLRIYLERAGRDSALDLLYSRLIAAWPEDYVYAYRYGERLYGQGKYAQALLYLEQAATKAYGLNRLEIARLRAQALLKLGRGDEAQRVAAEALKANGPWFPERTAELKALVARND